MCKIAQASVLNHVTHTRADWLLISGQNVDQKLKVRQSDRRAHYVLENRSFIPLWVCTLALIHPGVYSSFFEFMKRYVSSFESYAKLHSSFYKVM